MMRSQRNFERNPTHVKSSDDVLASLEARGRLANRRRTLHHRSPACPAPALI
jgi:hypothetical protein